MSGPATSAVTLPSQPISGDPLQRRVIDDTTVSYLVAYRGVTFVPTDDPRSLEPYETNPRFSVDEGPLGPENIHIYAEDLYIYVGSLFSFPGRRVTISARRIFTVSTGDASETDEITFDASGTLASDVAGCGTTGSDGANLGKLDGYSDKSPNPGGDGGAGQDCTTPGGPGGCFTILAELHSLVKAPVTLTVKTNGGAGGTGQAGGNGGNGGNGVDWGGPNSSYRFEGNVVDTRPYFQGGNGGNGGNGGRGSGGGAGGYIIDLTSSPKPTTDTTSAATPEVTMTTSPTSAATDTTDATTAKTTTTTSPTATANETAFSITQDDIFNAGAPGLGGSGGSGGTGGAYGRDPIIGNGFSPGESEHIGVAGTPGSDGSTGQTGPSDAEDGTLYSGLSKSSTSVLKAMAISPVQLAMVLQRLLFEWQFLFAAQPYDFQGDDKAALENIKSRQAQFSESCSWLAGCVVCLKEVDKDTSNDLVSKSGVMALRAQAWIQTDYVDRWNAESDIRGLLLKSHANFVVETTPVRFVGIDNYGLYYIKTPNLSLTDFQDSITALSNLEATRDKFFSALDTIETAKSNVSDAIDAATTTLETFENSKTKMESDMSTQYNKVKAAQGQVGVEKEHTLQALREFWEATRSQYEFSCTSLEDVLATVGNVCLLADGPFGVAAKVGAALSVGSSLGKEPLWNNQIDPADSSGQQDALQGKIYMLDANLNDDELQNELSEKQAAINQSSGSRAIGGGDQKFVDQIIVERAQFHKFCNRYFNSGNLNSDTATKLKNAKKIFDIFVNTCQDYHQAVIRYNEMAVGLAKLYTDQQLAQDTKNKMQAKGYDPTLPWLDMVYAFYSDAYAFQKARVIDILFQAVRCCNAAFLRRSTILDDLMDLGSFDGIGAAELQAACQTRLASDVESFIAGWNTNTPTMIPSSKSFNDKTDQYLMQGFRKNRTITFSIDETNAYTDFNFHKSWYDIRLCDIKIYFMDATNVNATNGYLDTQQIVVDIQTGAIFSVQDETGHVFTFETLEKSFSFAYLYDYVYVDRGHKYGDRDHESVDRDHKSVDRDHESVDRDHEYGDRDHEYGDRDHEYGDRDHESVDRDHKKEKIYIYKHDSKPASDSLECFNFAMTDAEQANPDFTLHMQTPMTEFTLSVDDSVDVTNVHEIRVEFTLQVRTRSDSSERAASLPQGGRYLLLVEAIDTGGNWDFRSWTASTLSGLRIANANTESNPFARSNNAGFPSGAWTKSISHGEVIHTQIDQTKPTGMCLLSQDLDPKATSNYDEHTWKLALVT